ncbi:hypothetical protein EYV94_18725 [Puteibacter caeruleilacunae]|nr:hypothetical protein EYV94_18725 [Puteibacter caeruleilacunae]
MTAIIAAGTSCSNKTPKEHLCEYKIDDATYQGDTIYLKSLIQSLVLENIDPFDLPAIFDSESIVNIDTVFYSPDLSKAVVFPIITNDYKKFISNPDVTQKYMCDAYHFFGRRTNGNKFIMNNGCSHIIVADSKEVLSESIKEYATERRSTGHPVFGEPKYNLDDLRFWRSKHMNFFLTDSLSLVEFDGEKISFISK